MVAHESQLWPIFQLTRPPRECFIAQVDSVYQHIDLRPERLNEITSQIGIPMQYWASILDLNPVDHYFTLELLSVALAGLSHVNQFAKHTLACPRPVAFSPSIQPIINPRRFSAFPSGHAAEAFLVARLLQALSGEEKRRITAPDGKYHATGVNSDTHTLETHLQRLAGRIADNRVVAGVHFPVDSTAGRMVGECFADYFLFRCGAPRYDKNWGNSETWRAIKFNGKEFRSPMPAADKFILNFDAYEALPGDQGALPSKYFTDMPVASDPRRPCIGQTIDDGRILSGRSPVNDRDVMSPFVQTSTLHALWRRVEAEWKHETEWNGDNEMTSTKR